MIKALILYYLNIKSTHGYEIQRFIQLSEMDQWTKIQSGSIYYALGKLEKEGLIKLEKEIGTGPKARKVYTITEAGRKALKVLAKEELSKELYPIGSDKFIVFPILDSLNKSEIEAQTKTHIKSIQTTLNYMKKWQQVKIHSNSLAIEALSFEMMISNLEYQIRWHETLLANLDQNMAASHEISKGILRFDFSQAAPFSIDSEAEINQLREAILANPDTAPEKLDELIRRLSRSEK